MVFSISYPAERADDPLVGPEAIVATASESHGLVLTYERHGDAVTFTVQDGYDAAELANLFSRLARRGLNPIAA